MPDTALEFKHVNKRFGDVPILQDISFQLMDGEAFGLVGVNGAGKTTLLKCLLDLCAVDSGTIEIHGVPNILRRSRNHVAFLPERFVPPHYLTGSDFIRYMLALQSVPYQEQAVEEMLGALDLAKSALMHPVRALSKGMTQKLGLAACLLSGKSLTVLDEPTSGLDPKARALLKAQLRHLKEQKRTLFLTLHALADVEEVCDRMALLHEGALRFVGTPGELCSYYQTSSLEEAFLACIETPQPSLKIASL
jgi:ABC-2 type transport system ATP-binding protein